MSIFNSLQVKGLRRLRDTSLKLKPLNVLVGANSSGKSTLLDAMCILSVGAAGQMHDQISQLGGYASLQTNLSACKGQNIRFVLDQNTDTDQPLKYVLEMAPKGVDYSIAEEILQQNRGRPTPFIHISAHRRNRSRAPMGSKCKSEALSCRLCASNCSSQRLMLSSLSGA